MLDKMRILGGYVQGVEKTPPVTPNELEREAEVLGVRLPPDFFETATSYASSVSFSWDLPGSEIPPQFPSCGGTGCDTLWDASKLKTGEELIEVWDYVIEDPKERAALPDPRQWLLLCTVGNGDEIFLDVSEDTPGVVYHDHEKVGLPDDPGIPRNVQHIADSFYGFVDALTLLAFPGPEIWELEEYGFLDANGKLNPNGEAGRAWRNWLNQPPRKWWEIWK